MNWEILNYISLDDILINKLSAIDKREGAKIARYGKRLAKGRTWGLDRKAPVFKLACALKAAERTLIEYRRLGISEEIFCASMDDIRIWCGNCGNAGLENIGWIKNHLSFKLFRIGRLQFQFFTARSPLLKYNKLPFERGERLIYVHIPQGEKLEYDACVSSLIEAGKFFAQYFPNYKYSYYFCESWLLYEDNKKFMSSNSNIVKFMNLFDLCYSIADDAQALERIFDVNLSLLNSDKRMDAVRALPEVTSLQRSAKKYMLEGNSLGEGIGVIDKYRLMK